MKKLMICYLLVSISACGDKDLSEHSDLQAIIRGEGIFAVADVLHELSPSMRDRLSAIGHLNSTCTAFHLGQGIVASAAHCFASQMQVEQPCVNAEVRWSDGSRSQCIQIVGYEWDDERDMILFEVDPAPAESLQWVDNLEQVEEALVIGYPHQKPLSISHQCSVSGQRYGSRRIFHDCDTLPGNSGSPVLDPQSGSVLGVHNGHEGSLNYATPISEWEHMLAEFERIRQTRQANDLKFGPFGDLENRLIHHFPKGEDNEWVRFLLHFNVEDGYDFINIRDGQGIRYRLTGAESQEFDLQTPIVISFESDYSGSSQSIEVEFL
ncbi:MAG: trypsin-like serine peptidase [Oligoflexus sp.]